MTDEMKHELGVENLEQVSGGAVLDYTDGYKCPKCGKAVYRSRNVRFEGGLLPLFRCKPCKMDFSAGQCTGTATGAEARTDFTFYTYQGGV